MSGTAYISGLISGLQTDDILAQLETLARVPVLRLEAQKATLSAKLSAWQTMNSQLLSLKEEAAALGVYTAFSTMTAASSNESLVTASVSGSPPPGDYTFTVQSLATTHEVASQGYAELTTLVGDGTVTITVGSEEAVEITANGLTLAGLRDAINASDANVNAFIIDDGSDTTPYRLLITSGSTGTAGEMTIDVSLSGGTAPVFSDLQTATDATLQMGTLTITRSSNLITDLIPGLTLDLHAADPATPVTVSVVSDTDAIKEMVQNFVTDFNAVIDYIDAQWDYNEETEQSGTLFGEFSLRHIQNDLISRVSNPITGLPSSLSLLSQVGITVGFDGKLSLDETILESALESDLTGVMKLFSRYGEASNADVVFISATGDTVPTEEVGYAVEITQAATQARVTAGVAQTLALAADEVLTINGVNITLTAGMTQSEVVDAINDHSAETGVTASATGSDGTGTGQYLTLKSNGYGDSTEVTAISDQSNATSDTTGIGNVLVTESSPTGESGTGTGEAGVDVAGTINGEAAEGSGQMLESTAGDSKGLTLLIRATSAGSYGTVDYTAGASALLDDMLDFLTESEDGMVKSSQNTLQERIDDIDESITKLEEAIVREQDRLRQQFTVMEEALAKLQTQSNFLSSQLVQMQNNWNTG